MPVRRHLPLRRPDLDQLRSQAKELLRSIHAGDPGAVTELKESYPDSVEPSSAKLADAQLILARSYGKTSWTRLVQHVEVIEAVWHDDLDAVRRFAGIDQKFATLALDHAIMQGKLQLGRELYGMAGCPVPPELILTATGGPLNAPGTALLFEIGARVFDDAGKLIAPVSSVLGSILRKASDKHAILEMYASHGVEFPDTATMAVHCGRIDLLERHLRSDRNLFTRTFSHVEIFPPELGCGDHTRTVLATPLDGGTLLHMAVEFAETDIVRWLLDNGADVNVRTKTDPAGFGGHTPLFATVVSQPGSWKNQDNPRSPGEAITRLLLERGADPNVRASLWTELLPRPDDPSRRYSHNVTALSWGRQFHYQSFVSRTAMELIEAAGGID